VVQGGTGYYKIAVRRVGVKVAYCKKKKNPSVHGSSRPKNLTQQIFYVVRSEVRTIQILTHRKERFILKLCHLLRIYCVGRRHWWNHTHKETEVFGGNLYQGHLVNQKSYRDWAGIEPVPQPWQANEELPEPRQGETP